MFRYHPTKPAYQIWEGSIDKFNVHKHYKLNIRQTRQQTDDRH